MYSKKSETSHRYKNGRYLINIAWLVELCAVIIGLMIAYMNGQLIKEQLMNPTEIQILMAMMPFIMIAIVEITKIPFAYAFYTAHNIFWKVLFGISLLFLMFVTFETAINGFERNFANMKQVIEEKRNEISVNKNEIEMLSKQIDILKVMSIEGLKSTFNEERSKIDEEIKGIKTDKSTGIVKQLRFEIKDLEKKIDYNIQEKRREKLALNDNHKLKMNNKVNIHNERKNRILADNTILNKNKINDLERNNSQLNDELAGINEEIKGIQNEKAKEIKHDQVKDDDSFLFSSQRNKIIKNYDEKLLIIRQKKKEARFDYENKNKEIIKNYEMKVTHNNLEIKKINKTIDTLFVTKELNSNIDKISNETKEIISNLNILKSKKTKDLNKLLIQNSGTKKDKINYYDKKKKELILEYELNKKSIISKNKVAEKLEHKIMNFNKEIGEIKLNINKSSSQIQVYRFAMWWFGGDCINGTNQIKCEKIKSISDLTSSQVNSVASIWFGSLAAIVAWTGVILALAGIVLRDESHKKNHHHFFKIIRSIRRILVFTYLKKKKTKIIEVIKEVEIVVEKEKIIKDIVEVIREVPVDKVVFKEIPIEIIRNEYVHVPLYTNDMTLLNTTDNKPIEEKNGK